MSARDFIKLEDENKELRAVLERILDEIHHRDPISEAAREAIADGWRLLR